MASKNDWVRLGSDHIATIRPSVYVSRNNSRVRLQDIRVLRRAPHGILFEGDGWFETCAVYAQESGEILRSNFSLPDNIREAALKLVVKPVRQVRIVSVEVEPYVFTDDGIATCRLGGFDIREAVGVAVYMRNDEGVVEHLRDLEIADFGTLEDAYTAAVKYAESVSETLSDSDGLLTESVRATLEKLEVSSGEVLPGEAEVYTILHVD